MTVIDTLLSSDPSMALPMGPFPARLRIGPSFDHIDVVACELTDTTGVEEAWEHGLALLRERFGVHVGRPGLAVSGGQVIITFGFSADTASIEFTSMLNAAALYAATMAEALSDDLTPHWREQLQHFGVIGDRADHDPREMLHRGDIAAWPEELA